VALARIRGRRPACPARFRYCRSAKNSLLPHSLTACGQPPSLRAAALDSLRSLRMWSTTTVSALPQYAKPAELGGVVSASRTS
jgi:hypothetical protein